MRASGHLAVEAWLAWALAATVAAMLTRNPFYLLLIGLAALVVRASVPAAEALISLRMVLLGGLMAVVLSGGLNMLSSHVGQTVLFRLPAQWPLVGGPYTAEALVYGVLAGLSIAVLLLVFATFSSTVEPADLLRRLPRFVHRTALVATIALTFVPQTRRALIEVREAQAIRGRRLRAWRDLPALVVPVMTLGLERAMALAEALEARGFGQHETRPTTTLSGLLAAVGLAGVLFGLFMLPFQTGTPWMGRGLLVLGGVMCLGGLWGQSRAVTRSRYRSLPLLAGDWLVMACSGGLLVGLMLAGQAHPEWLMYETYPLLTAPVFEPLVGIGLLLLAAPALDEGRRTKDEG